MKTVIITGANGNLGAAVTRTFLGKGYCVLAVVHSEKDKTSLPPHANLTVLTVDLSKEQEVLGLVATAIQQYGTIDAALLLAGGFAMGTMAETPMAMILEQCNLNFSTAYHIARPVFAHMLAKGNGRIAFVGAKPALEADRGKNAIAYGLSKSMLFKLAEYMNAEAKGKNVTVTVVVPSTIDTPPNRRSMPDADPAQWVKPEELAEILEFAVSEKSKAIREPVIKVYNHS